MTVSSPGWSASPARTVALAAPSAAPLRGISIAPLPPAWPAKSSADCLDVALDVAAWLAETGDSLAGLAVTAPSPASPTDPRVLWCTILSGQPVLFVGGGQPGTTVPVQVLLITSAGRRHAEQVQLPINAATPPTAPAPAPQLAMPGGGAWPIPPNAVALPDGSILTDDAGTPFLFA